MNLPVFSIRTILGAAICMMGLLALALALLSGSIHRDLVFNSQRSMMEALIHVEVNERLKDLTTISQDLGLALQSTAEFQKALNTNDHATLLKLLDNQFHQYFVTAGVIKLEQLVLLDSHYTFQLESSSGSVLFSSDQQTICPQVLERARQRVGAQRMTIVQGLCLYENRPIFIVFVPTGGLRLNGFIVIVTDPTMTLAALESNIGMPVRFQLNDKRIAFESPEWSEIESNSLVTEYELKTTEGSPVLTILTAQNTNKLSLSLQNARFEVFLITGVGTLFVVALSVFIARRAMLNPLNRITYKLRHMHTERSYLGEQLEVTGAREMHEIIHGFNAMSQELDNLYKSLERMAYTDSLTTLPNRYKFQQTLDDYIQLHKKIKKPFALLLLDLDRFKGVNDALGHNIGDELLKAVSIRLHQHLRDSDIVSRLDQDSISQLNDSMVARLGGDEFSVILTNIHTHEDSIAVAHKLVIAMEKPFVVHEHQLTIGLSIGIAMYPDHGEDLNTLVSHSDIAMYYAKRRNCGYSMYDIEQDTNSLRNLKLEQDLFASIKNNELLLHYQPKISLSDGSVIGSEALIRWQHPAHGLVSPNDFIPLAEQTGFIKSITEWVLNKALEDYSRDMSDDRPLSISVNLSALNLQDGSISSVISSALAKWAVPAKALTLELTESTIMSNPEFAIRTLQKLDAMGVSLSIDDFGTGYSSLAYIKKLPVDELKIDRSFIKDLVHDNNNKAIVRAILVLAHDMNLSVVAEGVENVETLDMLKELGCDIVQGYYFSRPVPFSEYIAWLGSRGHNT